MRARSFAKFCKKQLHYVHVTVYIKVVKYVVCVSLCVCVHTYIINFYTLIKAYRSQWYLNTSKMQVFDLDSSCTDHSMYLTPT